LAILARSHGSDLDAEEDYRLSPQVTPFDQSKKELSPLFFLWVTALRTRMRDLRVRGELQKTCARSDRWALDPCKAVAGNTDELVKASASTRAL
jgi:hypothetical protein